MFWTGKKSPVDQESEDWLIECWQWLIDNLDGFEKFRSFPLVLPTFDFFPMAAAEGHATAIEIFEIVAGLTGTANWPFDLIPQEDDINPVLGPLTVVQNAEAGPAGTFSVPSTARLAITYNPGLLDRPIPLIATFAHEIAHAILLTIREEVPGGPDLEEWATDVATVYLGFGLFGANSSVDFHQFSDVGSGSQGWSFRGVGYLNEAEWAFSLAIFLTLRGQAPEDAYKWLKPALRTLLKKSMRYLARHPERLAPLQGGA